MRTSASDSFQSYARILVVRIGFAWGSRVGLFLWPTMSFPKELTMKSEPMVRREVLKRCGGGALALVASSLAAPVARARTASPERDAIGISGRPTVAEDIARWLAELRYEDLPANVVAGAKRVTLDTLGCALGALDKRQTSQRRWLRGCRAAGQIANRPMRG